MEETKNLGGRPTKFTPEMQERILEGMKKVLVKRHAAAYAGIHHKTLYRYLEWGEEDLLNDLDTDYAKFCAAFKRTQADKIDELVDGIQSRKKNWQALAWLLERCFRQDYGQDAGIIQELLEKSNRMEDDFKKLINGITQQ